MPFVVDDEVSSILEEDILESTIKAQVIGCVEVTSTSSEEEKFVEQSNKVYITVLVYLLSNSIMDLWLHIFVWCLCITTEFINCAIMLDRKLMSRVQMLYLMRKNSRKLKKEKPMENDQVRDLTRFFIFLVLFACQIFAIVFVHATIKTDLKPCSHFIFFCPTLLHWWVKFYVCACDFRLHRIIWLPSNNVWDPSLGL